MNIYFEYVKSFHRLLKFLDPRLKRKREEFFSSHNSINFFNIPIFIISYNRLSYLKNLITRLEEMGYTNLKIIDNASTYPPLLKFYESTKYEVIRLKKNGGHMVFWENEIFSKYRKDLYVVTDPDVVPIKECPNDFMEIFYGYLIKYPRLKKVGFSLKIDDIPKNAPLYKKVLKWEKPYNFFKIPRTNAYSADIDTTFALYIPDELDISRHFITAVRIGFPYQLRHIPWYKTEHDVDEEEKYYSTNRTNGFWDVTSGNRTGEGPDRNFKY